MATNQSYKEFFKQRFNITTRDYDSIINEIVAVVPEMSQGIYTSLNESDPGFVLISAMAAQIDLHNTVVDRLFLESFLATCTELRNFTRLTSFSSYTYKGYTAGCINVSITPNSSDNAPYDPVNLVIPKFTQFSIGSVPFFAPSNLSVNDNTITVDSIGYRYTPVINIVSGTPSKGDQYTIVLNDGNPNHSCTITVTSSGTNEDDDYAFTFNFTNNLYDIKTPGTDAVALHSTGNAGDASLTILLKNNQHIKRASFVLCQGVVNRSTNIVTYKDLVGSFKPPFTYLLSQGKVAQSANNSRPYEISYNDGGNTRYLEPVDDVLRVTDNPLAYQLVLRGIDQTRIMFSPFFDNASLKDNDALSFTYVHTEGLDVAVGSNQEVTLESKNLPVVNNPTSYGRLLTTSGVYGASNPDTLEEAIIHYWKFQRSAGSMTTQPDWEYRLSQLPYAAKVFVKDVEQSIPGGSQSTPYNVFVGGIKLQPTDTSIHYDSLVPTDANPFSEPPLDEPEYRDFWLFVKNNKNIGTIVSFEEADILPIEFNIKIDESESSLKLKRSTIEKQLRDYFFQNTNFGETIYTTSIISHLLSLGYPVVDWGIYDSAYGNSENAKDNLTPESYKEIFLISKVRINSIEQDLGDDYE